MVVTIEDAIYNKETEIEIMSEARVYNIYLKISEMNKNYRTSIYFYSWNGKCLLQNGDGIKL